MADTPITRIPRDRLDSSWQQAWDMLDGLTGEPAFIEAMANAPELLNFAMVEFYQKIFFGGRVPEKYKQLVRLRLSLAHGCRSCNLQNTAGLKSTADGLRVRQSGRKLHVSDGPFTEAKEVVGGYALVEVQSREEALQVARQFMEIHLVHWPEFEGECEVRPLEDM